MASASRKEPCKFERSAVGCSTGGVLRGPAGLVPEEGGRSESLCGFALLGDGGFSAREVRSGALSEGPRTSTRQSQEHLCHG
eukprot:1158051-Amphidinium_carterae.1